MCICKVGVWLQKHRRVTQMSLPPPLAPLPTAAPAVTRCPLRSRRKKREVVAESGFVRHDGSGGVGGTRGGKSGHSDRVRPVTVRRLVDDTQPDPRIFAIALPSAGIVRRSRTGQTRQARELAPSAAVSPKQVSGHSAASPLAQRAHGDATDREPVDPSETVRCSPRLAVENQLPKVPVLPEGLVVVQVVDVVVIEVMVKVGAA